MDRVVIDSDQMTWSPETRTFIGELSTLNHAMDRACIGPTVPGFYIRSQRTGRELWFQRREVVVDGENDLLLIEFVAELPGQRPVRAKIYND